VTHDAGRPPGHGPDRHAIGITRTCLASGTVQLPFALAGSLPEGELLVHDAEADEPLVLWSEPPRRLAGLAPFFERHELQVNDSVVLEVRGDELRLATAKRPRRARPAVRPSTWHSLHDDRPEADPPVRPDADHARGHDVAQDAWRDPGPDASRPEATTPDAGTAAGTGRAADVAPAAPVRHDDALWDEAPTADTPTAPDAWARTTDPTPDEDDDAPRAPRVAVRPVGDAEAGASAPAGRPVRASDATALRPGPWARLGRLARSIFGRGDVADPGEEAASRARERDWTRAWDEDEEHDELAPTPEFVDEVAPPAPTARSDRGSPSPLDPAGDGGADERPDARGEVDRVPAPPLGAGRASDLEDDAVDALDLEDDLERQAVDLGADGIDAAIDDAIEGAIDDDLDPDVDRLAGGLPAATPLFPDAVSGARPRRPVDETPSGVPARAERFLGGDLRTRLLRYLESPEMGSIAQADRIAKRFDLDVETAAEMLADIADEPPDGLRLRPTRDGAWRIERTLRR
jgi:hypothetical protein